MIHLRKQARSEGPWILLLIGLWMFFFWRLFTPIEADQASLKKGDFSGQFVAFAAYQYQRFAGGEIPLWNPYNNGGLPFIGDTQAAAFYPPRLLTIAFSHIAGGWSYHALELEMTAHVLACSLFMFALVRRMTLGQIGSHFGAFIAAIIASYGGFLQSYPPLQLALLEAAIWLPLGVLGVYEASRNHHPALKWLVLTGLALGLSWMSGHPQTSWFLSYLLVAYWGYRSYNQHYRWQTTLLGMVVFGTLSGGLAALQLLPGFEYLAYTTRTGLGFEAKGNGFPLHDLVQFIIPGIVSLWSPLYVGVVGLTLALIALWRGLPGTLFWGLVVIFGIGLSFGANTPVFAFLYNLLPGLRFFRGQERAAYLVSFSLAILAGLGTVNVLSWDHLRDFRATRQVQRALIALLVICGGFSVVILALWLGNSSSYGQHLPPLALSVLIAAISLWLIPTILANPRRIVLHGLLAVLMIFELFTVSMDRDSNYDPVPPQKQLSMSPPPLIETVLADQELPFRVDGYRGLHDNYGSLYQVMDMRGISPLFLDSAFSLIEPALINPRAWELFAVRYVYSDWSELPVSSQIIMTGEDRYGAVNVHRLTNPRPFAHLVYQTRHVGSDVEARNILADPAFDARHTILLPNSSDIQITAEVPASATATIVEFRAEHILIEVNTPIAAILSLAHPYYPGWKVTLDAAPATLLRAYGGLSAVSIPSGQHEVRLDYEPLSFQIGALISLISWVSLLGYGLWLFQRRNHERHSDAH